MKTITTPEFFFDDYDFLGIVTAQIKQFINNLKKIKL